VMSRGRIRSIGAISALRGSETGGTQAPSIETAGAGPRRPALALAVFVLAFAALYFYLDATGSCGQLGCPEFSHANVPASIKLPHGVLVVVLARFPAMALAGRVRRRFASDRKSAEVYPSPEPDPPRPQDVRGGFRDFIAGGTVAGRRSGVHEASERC
jgi:hypothetical protein